MVFDVESIGLHGEAFAVAWVVLLPLADARQSARLLVFPAQLQFLSVAAVVNPSTQAYLKVLP